MILVYFLLYHIGCCAKQPEPKCLLGSEWCEDPKVERVVIEKGNVKVHRGLTAKEKF